MKVLTTRTPSLRAALITFRDAPTTDLRVVRIGVERVGIVAQAGDRDAVHLHQLLDGPGVFVGEVGDIDVGHAGIAAVGTARAAST